MALNSLSGGLNITQSWNAQVNQTGADYPPLTSSGSIRKSQSFTNENANNSLGGADCFVSYLITIANSGTATLDLTSVTNIAQQTTQSFARIKEFMFRLLSETDDTTNGTDCNNILIGNAAANAQLLGLSPSNATKQLFNGGVWPETDQRALGYIVDATHKNIKITNGDAGNAACVQVNFFGGTT